MEPNKNNFQFRVGGEEVEHPIWLNDGYEGYQIIFLSCHLMVQKVANVPNWHGVGYIG
jgi:hypothetical protein